MKLKILATADLHLGMRFSSYPEMRDALSQARFETLKRLVDEANREACELMVIAGDLFHRLTVPHGEIQAAARILKEFQGQAVGILPGNHDFHAGPSSPLWTIFRQCLEAAQEDRVLLLDRAQRTDLGGFGLPVHLYAAPCTSKHGRENPAGWITSASRGVRPDNPEVLHVGVAHGSIEGLSPDAQGEYFPMKRAELERAGLDLWIVGHTHRPYPDREDGEDWLLVPGTPEPDGFDCRHEGGAWLLEVSGKSQIRRRRLAVGRYRFRREELSIQDAVDPVTALARYTRPEYEHTLLRLALKGRLGREGLQELRRALPELHRHLPWLETDDSGLAETITRETIEAEFPRQSFSFRLLTSLLDDDPALQAAYALLLEARR